MAENQDVRVGMPDPFAHFQTWFNEELEKRDRQNQQLQAELDQFKQQNADLQARLDAQSTTDEASVSFATYSSLREQQEVTYKSLEVSLQALDKYKVKYQKAKDLVRPWQDYAKRCEERLRARIAQSATPESTEPIRRPRSAIPSSRPSIEPPPLARNESPAPKRPSPLPHAPSGVTEDTDELPQLDTRATSAPLTSNTRKVMAPPPVPDGSPIDPIQIKSEPNSSPLLHTREPVFTRTSTYDLDEAGEHITTPRKLQRTLLRQSSSFARSFPPPGGNGVHTTNFQTIKTSISQDEPSRALQPVSPNRNDLPRSTYPKTLAQKRKHHSAEEVVSVTEDGLGASSRSRPISPNKKLKADTTIKGLLTVQGPAKRQVITPKTKTSGIFADAQSVSAYSGQTDVFKTPASTALDFKKPGLVATPARRSPRKRATPLRQRSVSDLRLEDFKLNRAAHGDMDLETMNPLRTHADRRHMHSCVDPGCATCGSALRSIAKDMVITVGSELFANTQYDALSEDEKVLRYHLGETFSIPRLRAMPRLEYEELLLTAKTAILAERYGRHKLRPNARAKSPPGYWDVEMPTTQAMEAQQAERQQRERETVRERYREAMRRGGKWVFKDE